MGGTVTSPSWRGSTTRCRSPVALRRLPNWLPNCPLNAPVKRVTGVDVPMPYATNLEDLVLPTVPRVIEAVKRATYTS